MPVRITLDSSAVRHALSYGKDPRAFPADFAGEAKAFLKLLDLDVLEFCYTPLLENHVRKAFADEWEELKKRRGFIMIPAGETKTREALKNAFLAPDHNERLAAKAAEDAARVFRDENDYKRSSRHGKQKSREHDWEHLAAAIGAGADFFVTTDMKLLRRLSHLTAEQSENPAVIEAKRIAKTPSETLAAIPARRNMP